MNPRLTLNGYSWRKKKKKLLLVIYTPIKLYFVKFGIKLLKQFCHMVR